MTLETLEKKLKLYAAPLKNAALRWLYVHFPPRPILHKRMHRAYSRLASILMHELEIHSLDASSRRDVEAFLESVIPFIEAYEKKEMALGSVTPEDMLRFLMDQQGLSQYDLAKDLGGQPVVSAILRRKRKLTRDHIERLSRRFHISPAAFYPAAA